MRRLGWAGFIAWRWKDEWPTVFERLRAGGRPIVPPILQVAVLNREPQRVLNFVDEVSGLWNFDKIVPCHFDAPISGGRTAWSAAFDFLRPASKRSPNSSPFQQIARLFQGDAARPATQLLPEGDLAFLRKFEASLVEAGSLRPAAPLD
mmetsp:Transcript_24564/g.74885  ORF Transcript_24564/g.74885 Transcript_24564/m.74885 type:complete len:149 (+) Transcript_24564:65-511(+)